MLIMPRLISTSHKEKTNYSHLSEETALKGSDGKQRDLSRRRFNTELFAAVRDVY